MIDTATALQSAHRWASPVEAQPAPAQRILIVLHDFSSGGTENVAIRLANQWAQAGRDVRIFCGVEAGPLRERVGDEVSVRQAYPAIPRGWRSRERLGRALAAEAIGFRPDIVFGPGNFHMPVLARFARINPTGARIVSKISNPLIRGGGMTLRALLRRATVRRHGARIDGFVAMSPALRAEAAAHLPEDRIALCWEPISIAAPALPASKREPGLIVAVGRLEPQKDFALAIRAMARLDTRSDARLIIFGEGRERARLEALVAELGLTDRVSLPGFSSEIGHWLDRASCFLMTSSFEAYPAALVEAVAHGAPIVVTPCTSALDEILGHAGCVRIAERTPDRIAAALADVLGEERPAARATALSFRHEEARAAGAYLTMLDRICTGRPAGLFAGGLVSVG